MVQWSSRMEGMVGKSRLYLGVLYLYTLSWGDESRLWTVRVERTRLLPTLSRSWSDGWMMAQSSVAAS